MPNVMGIVNVTPDSFSDGGRHDTTAAAVAHALALLDDPVPPLLHDFRHLDVRLRGDDVHY